MREVSARKLRDILTAGLLFLATAAFTLWQNTRIAVLWDISFLLDTSYRWSLGQLPYKDLPFPYAPLTFLLHTGIIQIFGHAYYPHILCAALEAGIATLLTWRILLTILKPFSNRRHFLAAVLAAPLAVVGIYAIYPHPIYDSDCILAILFALYLLQRAESRSRRTAASPVRNFTAGAACVLPLFIKQNIGLPFLLVTLASVAVIAVIRRLQRASVARQLWLFAGAATALTLALLLIQAVVGLHNYVYWTITFAAQRRLPGLSVVLGAYRQTSLLWTLPATAVALILLHKHSPGAPSMAQPYRGMGGRRYRFVAILLLGAPFLWTIASLVLTNDPVDRADQILTLWPHLLILSAVLALCKLRPVILKSNPNLDTFLPFILLATIHGAFLSQQLWGSTYAIWPLLTLLIALLLTQVPNIAQPVAAIIAVTFLLCGGLYAISHERLSYIRLQEASGDPPIHSTLPELQGLATPGPWIPDFEELIRFTSAEIPGADSILLIPAEDPFYFTTGRTPTFPVLLIDPATDPYTPEQTAAEARTVNIRWLIVKRTLQLNADPHPQLPEIIHALQPDFILYRTLTAYDIYRRK